MHIYLITITYDSKVDDSTNITCLVATYVLLYVIAMRKELN